MLVMAMNPGHDGAAAAINGRTLELSVEGEKDSFFRHSALTPSAIIDFAGHLGDIPDVVSLGGWHKPQHIGLRSLGAGYGGLAPGQVSTKRFFGKEITFFSSSHERSHVMMALGMAPASVAELSAVLVWEGVFGNFYLVNRSLEIVTTVPVLAQPGARYAFLFALADPTFPDEGTYPRASDSGKLMALSAYGTATEATQDVRATVDRVLALESLYPAPKSSFRESPVYNAGVQSPAATTAAALLGQRIFDVFAQAAMRHLPAGLPLYISGGCGLNCDWNSQWRELGHFASVFVPPCANDSGSAIGTGIDALATLTGDAHIEWDVYSGLAFEEDATPDPGQWTAQPLDGAALARVLGDGHVVAWVQGRWEIGPRALGHRSLLAEPFNASTHQRLNAVKKREDYRPIAPVCRVEDLAAVFYEDFEDPYMLYFRRVRPESKAEAITHVDGSARAQSVTAESNPPLHALLTEFARQRGVGLLCNTSLNFNGRGFINRMSDLLKFSDDNGVDDIVVGERWFSRRAVRP